LLVYEARRKALLDELSALKRAEKRGGVKVAFRMIRKGMDNETIANLTDLTQEEIEQLHRQ
jgi:predicted transposase/invertase (TIGR01784 family)